MPVRRWVIDGPCERAIVHAPNRLTVRGCGARAELPTRGKEPMLICRPHEPFCP
jgi:hypothetical protein